MAKNLSKSLIVLVIALTGLSVHLFNLYNKSNSDVAALQARLVAQNEPKIAELKKHHEEIFFQITSLESLLDVSDISPTSVLYHSAHLAISEYKLLQSLIDEQIVALETNAPFRTVIEKSEPNPQAAETLRVKLQEQEAKIKELEENRKYEPSSLVGASEALTISLEQTNLAMLYRSYLSAEYGLKTPFPISVNSEMPAEPIIAEDSAAAAEAD
ncbi:MAG: hypothetical protein LBJ64_11570 [Deltaproteobacteria bacterium]|jgi:hypothetical protein|nr:hypothetical protein [Deltaproteobacteria bacterium]